MSDLPDDVTPAGVTFAAMGSHILLQGAGTVLMAAGSSHAWIQGGSSMAGHLGLPSAWQPSSLAACSDGKATSTLHKTGGLRAGFLLAGGFASMIKAGSLIRGGTAA